MNFDISPRELAIITCIVVAMLAAAYPWAHVFEGTAPSRRLAKRNSRRELWALAALFVSVSIGAALLFGGA